MYNRDNKIHSSHNLKIPIDSDGNPLSAVVCRWTTLTQQCYFFQGTTSGFWTETGFLVRPVASHKCGASLPPLTPCSPAATARAKHTFSG